VSVVAAEQPVDVSAIWRALRLPAALIVIGLALVTILAAIGTTPNSAPLDPRNDAPNGAHALAALLGNRGISVSVASDLQQLDTSGKATIVLSDPAALSDRAMRSVATSAATVLLIDPQQQVLTAFGVDAAPDAQTSATTLDPGCSLPAAVTAGSVRIDGDLYAAHGKAITCYGQGADASLIVAGRPDGATTIVLGSPSTLSNAQLATAGDAALALGLLAAPVIRWVPGGLNAGPVPKSQRGLLNLLPSRLLWATLQLFIALAVLALWRARRLGPPVAEPLPVVVRSAETAEGSGRLLHAAHARDAAAGSLRKATIRRLSHSLRLGPDEDAGAITALVAERTHWPAAEISSLLYGGEPADDAALVELAQELPFLETALHTDDRSGPQGQQ
jgi:hypothetical protein